MKIVLRLTFRTTKEYIQIVVKLRMKTILSVNSKSSQKDSQKVAEKVVMEIGLRSKYSGLLHTFVDCQKDSQTTVGIGTHLKPVLLAVKIFAVL